ncbi:MAG: roadblock/LC7 domain-containing protein [Promethearchaeota archaeon]
MDPVSENLDDILKRLLATIPEATAAAIVSMEGLPIASALPQGFDETRVSALMASLHSLSRQSIIEMNKGELNQLYIKGSDGYLLVRPAGPNALLAISTTNDVSLGLIFSDLRSEGGAYRKIIALMEQESVSEITIERQYLPEILSERYLKISSDGFPMLKNSVAENLLLRGIKTEYWGTVVRFIKNS